MKIKLPNDVLFILNKLSNYEAYVVGGCVRDSILGIKPNDWDICTSAKVDEIIDQFKDFHIIKNGIKHKTVGVVINAISYEISSFKDDLTAINNDSFEYSLKNDLARRDFTINAMAYNDNIGLVDYYGGQKDLKNSIIKCVINPIDRFNEDGLRVLRALRFSSVYNFDIDNDTSLAIKKSCSLLQNIAPERIKSELCKFLIGVKAVYLLDKYWYVFNEFIPEIDPMVGFNQNNPYHIYDVYKHTIIAIDNSEPNLVLRLSLLLHDIGKPECYSVDEIGIGHFYNHDIVGSDIARYRLNQLKFDNETINAITTAIKYHSIELSCKQSTLKRWLNKVGNENLRLILQLKLADISAHSQKSFSNIELLNQINQTLDTIIIQEQCFKIKDLKISGKDLIDIGITNGKDIGTTLNEVLLKVIDCKLENDKEILLNYLKNRI